MHNPFDHLAKKVGKGALDASGPTIVQYEISRDAQHADLRHDPDPARGAERARLGLLGRLAEVLCLIEIYAHSPDGREIRACLGKHFSHWEEHAARERAHARRRAQRGLPPEPVQAPCLWIIAASCSASIMAELKLAAAPGWPQGVYFHGGEVCRAGLVVAAELPRERSTLLVRIMAAGPGLLDAIADLTALPRGAHERTVAEQILVHLRHVLAKKPTRTLEEEDIVVRMKDTWEGAERIGEAKGEIRGKAQAVLAVLRVRGIAVSDAERERILNEKNLAKLERWHERAVLAGSVAEVFSGRRRAA